MGRFSLKVRIICLLLSTFIALFQLPAQANWLDNVLYESKRIVEQLTQKPTTEKPLLKSDVSGYPSHYRFNRVVEPYFNTPLFYFEAGDKRNPPIVFVHGLGDEASTTWLEAIPELEKKYHVIAFDLPGFGLSKGPYFEYSPEQYSKVIDWLISQLTNEKPILIGHSMGGAISLYFAANYPHQISKLILIDAAGILERTSYIKQLTKIPRLPGLAPKSWQRFASNFSNFSDKWVEKTGDLYDPTKLLKENRFLRQILLSEQNQMNAALALIDTDFSQIQFNHVTDTHLIWGSDDIIAPIRIGNALMGRLPKAKLHTITGAGHIPMKTHVFEFNQILLNAISSDVIKSNPKNLNLQNQTVKIEDTSFSNKTKQRKTECNNDDHSYFSGNYDSITLTNCKLVVLNNVTTKELKVSDSILTINNSHLGSLDSLLLINNSSLVSTSSQFFGTIIADKSRLDFASSNLNSTNFAMEVNKTSSLVFSLSKINSLYHKGSLHGFYKLKNGPLDLQLR